MPKKNKTLCVDDLRHAEYYGMQPVFDELYHRSLEGENFTDLMDLILSRDNILLAYRNIKANGGQIHDPGRKITAAAQIARFIAGAARRGAGCLAAGHQQMGMRSFP